LRRPLPSRKASAPRGVRRAAVALIVGLGLLAVRGGPAGAVLPPRHGATLVVAARGPVATLDPARATTAAERDLSAALFDRLVAEAPDGTIVGSAAGSWSVDADSSRWTFRLRTDLHFSNGRPLTAADFVTSFARLDRSLQPEPRSRLIGAVRARAVDDRTLVVEFDRHRAGATLAVLADPLFSAVLVVTADGGESLLGSGPFRFTGQADGGFVLAPRLDHPLGRPAPGRVIIAPYGTEDDGARLLGGVALARHDETPGAAGPALEVDAGVLGVRRTSHGVLDLTTAFHLR
jgi:peptide/nickel transport system substrate-binding protein